MKRTTSIFLPVLACGLAIGLLSCGGSQTFVRGNSLRVSLSGPPAALAMKTTCCETTMTITANCASRDCIGASSTATSVTDHSMFSVTSLTACACGPDTVLRRVVGPDSMMVTKTGSWLTAYFSATVPIVDSLSAGGLYSVVFRRM